MTNTIDTIIKVVAFIYVFIDVFNPLIKQLITLTKAHTRNKNLVFAESIASQVVDFVSKTSDLTGDQRKKLATDTIWKRLKENGLADRFTEALRIYRVFFTHSILPISALYNRCLGACESIKPA